MSDDKAGKLAGRFLIALKGFDWGQPIFHGGIPCFHLAEDGFFCGRAQAWDGHPTIHKFVPLHTAAESFAQRRVDEALEAVGEKWKEWASDHEIYRAGWEIDDTIRSMKSQGATNG